MKDLPHHMKYANKKVIAEKHHEKEQPFSDTKSYDEEYRKEPSKSQKKKLLKEARKAEKEEHTFLPKTIEERERDRVKTKKAVPMFRKRSRSNFIKK